MLVRVRACVLNHLDLWVRRGLPGVAIPPPHIPGSDVAGEVAKIGENVKSVKVGQKVVLAPGVTCGRCAACIAGQDNRCREFTNLGYRIDGGCGEFVRCPEMNLPAVSGKSGLGGGRGGAAGVSDSVAHAGGIARSCSRERMCWCWPRKWRRNGGNSDREVLWRASDCDGWFGSKAGKVQAAGRQMK